MATWCSVSRKLKEAMVWGAIFITVAVGVSVVPFLGACQTSAEVSASPAELKREQRRLERTRDIAEWEAAREQRRQEREAARATLEEKSKAQRETLEAELAKASNRKSARPARRVRRFRWESPAETRSRIWNVPAEESEEALLTALLRVCIAEAGGHAQDCVGIWQVVKNTRIRSCNRAMVRRITECEEDGGETYLSALRRHQRHVLGYISARNKRALWIRNLTPDCEMPKGWTRGQNRWDAYYGSKICPQTVADARRLISGELPEQRPGQRTRWLPGRPITWGGKCEEKMGSCDDRMACERVLARIPTADTRNAFWCRISAPGCRRDPEPICLALGYRYEKVEYRGRKVWKLRIGVPAMPMPEPAELEESENAAEELMLTTASPHQAESS